LPCFAFWITSRRASCIQDVALRTHATAMHRRGHTSMPQVTTGSSYERSASNLTETLRVCKDGAPLTTGSAPISLGFRGLKRPCTVTNESDAQVLYGPPTGSSVRNQNHVPVDSATWGGVSQRANTGPPAISCIDALGCGLKTVTWLYVTLASHCQRLLWACTTWLTRRRLTPDTATPTRSFA
jgi:hypothetical protein